MINVLYSLTRWLGNATMHLIYMLEFHPVACRYRAEILHGRKKGTSVTAYVGWEWLVVMLAEAQ